MISTGMMRCALQLAAAGRGAVAPNPMVGSRDHRPDGRIIGQGWHRRFGGPHAEVNAVASVAEADRDLLRQKHNLCHSLEPCSHYGKTLPCARLLAECRFARVVVGAGDPKPESSRTRNSHPERRGNRSDRRSPGRPMPKPEPRVHVRAHTPPPMVTLKWAQSSNGFLDGTFSTPLTRQIVHWRRAHSCAIAVGANTVIADNPSLDTRHIEGNSTAGNPRPPQPAPRQPRPHYGQQTHNTRYRQARHPALLAWLYADRSYTSLLVEGGAGVLDSFIASGMWNEAFV